MQKVTFREVHDDLEREAMLLQLDHNIEDFKNKASFLKSVGFTSSIATKLYADIAEKQTIINNYNQTYVNNKFIIESQLERLCEKYDLYVRDPYFFLGDIPEKNINDIMTFKAKVEDVFKLDILDRLNKIYSFTNSDVHTISTYDSRYVKLPEIVKLSRDFDSNQVLSIAAVKSLFSPLAFQESNARILQNKSELEAKNKVEMDPIVLLKVHGGYLIITAWGDEANDELVVNQKLN